MTDGLLGKFTPGPAAIANQESEASGCQSRLGRNTGGANIVVKVRPRTTAAASLVLDDANGPLPLSFTHAHVLVAVV